MTHDGPTNMDAERKAALSDLERENFLKWLEDEQGLYGEDVVWEPERNCFAIFGIHLAWCAWRERAQRGNNG